MSETAAAIGLVVGKTLINWVGAIIGAMASVVAGIALKGRKEMNSKIIQTEQEVHALKQQQESDHKLLKQKMDSIQSELSEFKNEVREEVRGVRQCTESINQSMMQIALALNIKTNK